MFQETCAVPGKGSCSDIAPKTGVRKLEPGNRLNPTKKVVAIRVFVQMAIQKESPQDP